MFKHYVCMYNTSYIYVLGTYDRGIQKIHNVLLILSILLLCLPSYPLVGNF